MKDRIKHFSHYWLRQHAINRVMRGILKPLSPILPGEYLRRIPVNSCIDVPLQSGSVLQLESDGYDSIASRLYWQGLSGFEPESLQVFQQLLPQVRTVFDVGANIGLYALIAGIEDEKRMVYAFEPVPEVFQYLKNNIALNQLINVKAIQAVVCNQNDDVDLYVPETKFHLPVSASIDQTFQSETCQVVIRGITLDDFVKTQAITDVDLLKIDTEATEHLVVQGAQELIKQCRPMMMCEVLPGAQADTLEKLIAKHEYRFYQITPTGLVPRMTLSGGKTIHDRNYLFLPTESAERIVDTLRETIIRDH